MVVEVLAAWGKDGGAAAERSNRVSSSSGASSSPADPVSSSTGSRISAARSSLGALGLVRPEGASGQGAGKAGAVVSSLAAWAAAAAKGSSGGAGGPGLGAGAGIRADDPAPNAGGGEGRGGVAVRLGAGPALESVISTEAGVAIGCSRSSLAAGNSTSVEKTSGGGAGGIRGDELVRRTGAPPSPAGVAERGTVGGGTAGEEPSAPGIGTPPFRRVTASGMRCGAVIWIAFPQRQRMR